MFDLDFLLEEDKKSELKEIIQRGLTVVRTSNRNGRFYASTGGICARKSFLHVFQPGTTITSASLRFYAEIGNTVETLILEALKKENRLLAAGEFLPNTEIDLGGIIDGLIIDKLNEQECPFILEIKTCESIPPKAKLNHYMQTLLYSAIIGLPAKIVYIPRARLASYDGIINLEEFEVPFTYDELRIPLWELVMAGLCYALEVLPDKKYGIKKTHCSSVYCPFVNHCWNTQDFSDYDLKTILPEDYKDLQTTTDKIVDEILNVEKMAKRRADWLREIAKKSTFAKEFLVNFFNKNGFDLLDKYYEQNTK